MFSGFNTAKCETTIRLCLGRIKLQRNKKITQVKSHRREIADLLKQGKQEYARIRVEAVIRENSSLMSYEILELYLELLAMRVNLISKTKEIPRDMIEAISSLIYASQRISDMPELGNLRTIFASKYGKEYVAEASNDVTCSRWQVNVNLIRCLTIEPPQSEEKLAMLSEIAQEYGVEWDLGEAARQLNVQTVAPCMPINVSSQPVMPVAAQPTAVAAPAPQAQAGYTNAHQAAAAAQQAAAHAQTAAHYAAQYAQHGNYASVPAPMPPAVPIPQPQVVPADYNRFPQIDPAAGPAEAHPGNGFEFAPHFPTAHAPGGYAVKSDEEIQQAYDAAMGPPSKGGKVEPEMNPTAPTSLPPMMQLPTTPPMNNGLPAPPSMNTRLPTPPSMVNGVNGGSEFQAPPPPRNNGSQVEDEYEELTRRLDALKRS